MVRTQPWILIGESSENAADAVDDDVAVAFAISAVFQRGIFGKADDDDAAEVVEDVVEVEYSCTNKGPRPRSDGSDGVLLLLPVLKYA